MITGSFTEHQSDDTGLSSRFNEVDDGHAHGTSVGLEVLSERAGECVLTCLREKYFVEARAALQPPATSSHPSSTNAQAASADTAPPTATTSQPKPFDPATPDTQPATSKTHYSTLSPPHSLPPLYGTPTQGTVDFAAPTAANATSYKPPTQVPPEHTRLAVLVLERDLFILTELYTTASMVTAGTRVYAVL
ncbi:hypothetical protein P692DRAFT_201801535 [Suillus brevipes Sb2]|nr:hypothetical protein P692DRAFT_201801535 [Suillus brevipes Sb2]